MIGALESAVTLHALLVAGLMFAGLVAVFAFAAGVHWLLYGPVDGLLGGEDPVEDPFEGDWGWPE